MPTAKGAVPAGTTTAVKNELLKVLGSIQQETAIVVPDDVTVELMEAAGKTSSEFSVALDYFGKQITKAILGQTLATDQNSKTGSLAQAKVHQDTLISYVTELKSMLESVVNEQIIKDIIDYNFTDRYYPQFILPLDAKDLQAIAQVIYQLVTCGEIEPGENWIREYMGLPERDKVEQSAPQTTMPTTPVPKRVPADDINKISEDE